LLLKLHSNTDRSANYRRLRSDTIYVYKMLLDLVDLNFDYFTRTASSATCGHGYKLQCKTGGVYAGVIFIPTGVK